MVVYIKNTPVQIDREDLDFFNSHNWRIVDKKGTPYVYSSLGGKTIYFYREILGVGDKVIVDHINGDTLDNRKNNLRVSNKRKNAQNMKSNKNSTSVFKGVSWDKFRLKWKATIKHNNKQVFLGRFDCEKEAALAYNKAASEYFGEFARLNLL